MSYEPSGLSGPSSARKLVSWSRLPHPRQVGPVKRRARPHELTATLPRLPSNYVLESELTGLGFSLKPPKWIRKMQPGKILKKAIVPAAIIGGSLLIPGVGGVVAKGLTSAGKLALGAGKLAFGAGKGILGGAARLGVKTGSGIAKLFGSKIVAGTVGEKIAQTSIGGAGSIISNLFGGQAGAEAAATPPPPEPRDTGPAGTFQPDQQVPYSPPTYSPDYGYGSGGGGGGGGYSAPAAAEAPAQAGMDSNTIMMLGIGLVALVAVSGALKGHRR